MAKKLKPVEFARFTAEEKSFVTDIVKRTALLFHERGETFDQASFYMDLAACHASCPLNLGRLAGADRFTFAHDVMGIINTMDRETGKLTNFFEPRCAKRESEKAGAR